MIRIKPLISLLVCLLVPGSVFAATNISQYGITWTFNKDYTIGQFVNGDYYVIGDPNVTITHIDPCSFMGNGVKLQSNESWVVPVGRYVNGSMVNPGPIASPYHECGGYDSWLGGVSMTFYKHSLNKAWGIGPNTLTLEPNSSLVSGISMNFPAPSGSVGTLRTAAVLTILASIPEGNSFRPGYAGTTKRIHNVNDIQWDLLQSITKPLNAPSLTTMTGYFQRPWIDHGITARGRTFHPQQNLPAYGQSISSQVGDAALMLHLDYTNTEKKALLVNFLQVGIDNYSVVTSGLTTKRMDGTLNRACWYGDGGHTNGRKWPILFAGLMFDDPCMANIGAKSGNYGGHVKQGYAESTLPDDYIHFGEDDQTYYVTQHCIDRSWNADTNDWYTATSPPPDQSSNAVFLRFDGDDMDLPEHGKFGSVAYESKAWQKGYRRTNTAAYWAGWVLAAHIMNVKTLWNHNALFDYMDRYMAVEQRILDRLADPNNKYYRYPDWLVSLEIERDSMEVVAGDYRQTSAFAEGMWDTYRADYPPVWLEETGVSNLPPILDPIGNKDVNEGELLTFDVNATDPDPNAILTYSVEIPGWPAGADFNSVTRIFSWTPSAIQQGPYTVIITVRDEHGACDSETIVITVRDTGAPTQEPGASFVGRTAGNATASRYYHIDGTVAGVTAESQQTFLIPSAATLKKLYVWTENAPGVGKGWTITVRKNGEDTALTATISGSATSATATINVGLAVWDTIDIYITASGSPAASPIFWCVDYSPAAENETLLSGTTGPGTISGTSTRYIVPKAYGAVSSSANRWLVMPFAGTVKKLYVTIGTAPGDTTWRSFIVRKNGDNQSLAITISNLETSGFDDANSFAVVAGDTLEIISTRSGTITATTAVYSFVIVPNTTGLWGLYYVGNALTSTADTNYVGVSNFSQGTLLPVDEAAAYQKVRPIIVTALYTASALSPGTDKNYTFTLREAVLGDSELGCQVSNSATACNDSDSIEYAEGALLSTKIVPNGSPTPLVPNIGYAVEYPEAEEPLPNNAPVLAAIGNKEVNENSELSFYLDATDEDSDPLTYGAHNLPAGAILDGNHFSWTPDYDTTNKRTSPKDYSVAFYVTDGNAYDSQSITITVRQINRISFDAIGPKDVNEGSLLTFIINATDVNGQEVSYSATSLPEGATFNAVTKQFAWTPGYYQAGEYRVGFTVTISEDDISQLVPITVNNIDRAKKRGVLSKFFFGRKL